MRGCRLHQVKGAGRTVYLALIPYMVPAMETVIAALHEAGANGTGGPLLVTLVLGALAAADTARARMMMRYWEIAGPPPCRLLEYWERVQPHLRLCTLFGLLTVFLSLGGILAGKALPVWTVWPVPWAIWVLVFLTLMFRKTFLLEPLARRFMREQA